MVEYLIPKVRSFFEEEIKKSRFITYLQHTEGLEQAKAFWQKLKRSTLMPAIIVGRQWPASQTDSSTIRLFR